MPRKAIDYKKTIIYKLVRNDDFDNADVYVGSTTDCIRRKSQHKHSCHNENRKGYNLKVYQNIRQNGGWENWTMIEIEKYPCSDKREAEAREEWWRCEFNAKLNSKRAFITIEQRKEEMKQYRTEHSEYQKEYQKEYRTANPDKIKEKSKKYHIENAEKLKEKSKQYRSENADKIKQYNNENAEKMREKSKQYYTEHAEKLNQKYECDCGSIYTHKCKSRHLKSKKHQNYILLN